MAIGSAAEIGTLFKPCRDYTMEDWDRWWTFMRTHWGGQLQAGYAVLIHKKEGNPYYDQNARRAQHKTNE